MRLANMKNSTALSSKVATSATMITMTLPRAMVIIQRASTNHGL